MTLAQLKEKLARPVARKITPSHAISKVHKDKSKYKRERFEWDEGN